MNNWPAAFPVGPNFYSISPMMGGSQFSQNNSGSYPPERQSSALERQSNTCEPEPTYSYFVRIINPKKKSDYIVRVWHNIKRKFNSLTELKIALMDSFTADIPSTTNFHVGYLEPPGNTKCWLVDERDLMAMYSSFPPRSKVNLWCDAKTIEDSAKDSEPPSKKKKSEKDTLDEETQEVFTKLHEQHPGMESPKLRLWAKLIQGGRYDSYDTPPKIPLITGAPAPQKPAKQNVGDALAGAATAIVKALSSPNQTPSANTRVRTLDDEGAKKISPLKMTNIRRNCLDDLKKLKELFEDHVLTEEEFKEEKKHILDTLNGIR